MITIWEILIYSYIFVFGAVIGSFLNVLIYRLPNDESLIYPSSRCPHCQHKLAWYELIPIASYFIQGGKCKYCRSKISIQYPIIEAITGGLFVLTFVRFDFTALALIYGFVFAIFLAIIIIDWRYMIIPDELNIIIGIMGLMGLALGITNNLFTGLAASFLAGLSLWLLAVISRGGMGGGDIKFAFAIGLFMNWGQVLLMFFLASILGSIYGLYVIIRHGYQARRPIPFGPFLMIGASLALIYGQDIINYYLSLFIR